MQAWAALLALAGCIGNPLATRRALSLGLAASLGALAKATQAWGVAAAGGSAGSAGAAGVEGWAPSNAELSAAVLSACCALTHDSIDAKLALASSGEAAAAAFRHQSQQGQQQQPDSSNLLHQLVSVGVYSGVQASSKMLSLALCSSLLRAPSSSPTLQKAALAHVLSLGLQRALSVKAPKPKSAAADAAETTPFLLQALAACMLSEAVSGAASGGGYGPGRDITNTISQLRDAKPMGDLADADFKPATVPQLLEWVADAHADRPDILAAAVRSLASLAAAAAGESVGERGGSPAAKRLFAIAGSVEPIKLLLACAASSENTLAVLANVALWLIIHTSSAAQANARAAATVPLTELLLKARPSGVYGAFGAKATTNILSLIEFNSV